MRWLRNLFARRPSAADAARTLAYARHKRRKAIIRAKCDEMRREMGLPAVRWPT